MAVTRREAVLGAGSVTFLTLGVSSIAQATPSAAIHLQDIVSLPDMELDRIREARAQENMRELFKRNDQGPG